MRKTFIVLIISVLTTVHAVAGSPLRNKSFSLNAGTSIESYGCINGDGGIQCTEYSGIRVEPDWRFANRFGLKLSMGSAWAFATNATGTWDRPIYSVCNAGLAATPYYEFPAGKWFFDLGPVIGCRVRLPYLNTEPSKYMITFSASAGVDFRTGYRFSEKCSCFLQADARRTFYDYLYSYYYPSQRLPVSGCITAALGFSYRF